MATLMLSGCGSSSVEKSPSIESIKQSTAGGEYTFTIQNQGNVKVAFSSSALTGVLSGDIADVFGASIDSATATVCHVSENSTHDGYEIVFDQASGVCDFNLYSTLKSTKTTSGQITFTSNAGSAVYNYTNQGYLLAGGFSVNDDYQQEGNTFNRYTNGAWGTPSTANGLDANINVLAVGRDGTIYAGGQSLAEDTETQAHTATFNTNIDGVWGTANTASGINTIIYALALSPTGDTLYVGGRSQKDSGPNGGHYTFNSYNTETGSWGSRSVAGGLNGNILSFAVAADGIVYAGGDSFVDNTAGQYKTFNIMATDGQWGEAEIVPGIYEDIFTILIGSDGDIYVGGGWSGYTENPDDSTFNIYSGGAWGVPSTAGGLDLMIYTLVESADGSTIYAGGASFPVEDNTKRRTLNTYTNGAWNDAVTEGLSNDIQAIVIDAYGSIYVGGTGDKTDVGNYQYDTFNIYSNGQWQSADNKSGITYQISTLDFYNKLSISQTSSS